MMYKQGIPRNEYPRPNFVRDLWVNLNGQWEFEFDDQNAGEKEKWFKGKEFSKQIVVPFCYQSELSGIGDKSIHNVVWYKRDFALDESFNGKKVFINFGAVDFCAKVWVNGEFVGIHTGGYVAFSFDITSNVKDGTNVVVVRVEDKSFDCI